MVGENKINNWDSQKTITGPVFLIMTGFICNNNCIMCSVRPKALHHQPRKTEEIMADLEKGRDLQYKRVEFTGGEPTARKDLLLLVNKAKKLGYEEIALGTNARTFSALDFLKTLKKHGVNRITTTLCGYNTKSHEAITRAPYSFQQTLQGIKNSLSLDIITTVNTVVFSLTAPNLNKIGKLLVSFGIEYWTLLDLIPDGYALEKYKIFALSPKDLQNTFQSIEKIIDKFRAVNIFDFPFCLIPGAIFHKPNCNILAARGRMEIINQIGYKPKRFEEKNNVFYDIHKTRIKQCRQCAYNNECGGIWTLYQDLYPDSFSYFQSLFQRY